MQITDESLVMWEDFFRLLGQAVNMPSNSTHIALGRFVVEQQERFVTMVESLPGTAGQHIKLYEYEGKYIKAAAPSAGRVPADGD